MTLGVAISGKLARLVEREEGRCHLCGGMVVTDDLAHPGFPSRDHVIPKAYQEKGTPNEEQGRIRLAHRSCNSYRGAARISPTKDKYIRHYQRKLNEYYARDMMVDGIYTSSDKPG